MFKDIMATKTFKQYAAVFGVKYTLQLHQC